MAHSIRQRLFAIVVLTSQLFSTALLPMWHHDVLLCDGAARQGVDQHADADNCRHVPLSDDDFCAVCLFAHSRITSDPVPSDLAHFIPVGRISADPTRGTQRPFRLDCPPRRGPPSLLG